MRKDYDPSRKGARQLYNLRSMSQWIAAKAKYDAATSQKERDAVLKEYGAQNFREGTFFPCWDFWGAPQDLMHVELEGLLKDELYLVLFEMAKHGWISCKEFNKAKEKHRWPGGARLCDLKPEHFQGQTGGKPKRNYKSLPFSAHDMLLLVVDSIVLLQPFVKDWNADFWQHQMLFLSIEDYFHFWVPKHHFATHIPLDILFWGPPINYWCMMLESENQVFKKEGKHSNFKILEAN
ncbi:hypothetical protein Ctob_014991 [Chrysochromulina tobinii]|uniref:Uncharacterized protein n=1 Tax=Chrysochromulina tobinii TaxID=1460289 RepID=A0A0M0JSI7_9EUKA|nr:hypothetical protein Ctob_014991 [Chrysochromulina tobinii]|eukprot:KOO29606.1 hypothetical protein Ctob_014991 [Chrysochromulina sp. CCMP291]